PLARQGAAVVGPRLSLPRAAPLSVRQPRLQAAAGAVGRRRLRPRPRLLVHRRGPPPQALAAVEAKTRTEDGRSSPRLPASPAGAVSEVAPIENRGRHRRRLPAFGQIQYGLRGCTDFAWPQTAVDSSA